MEDLIKVLEKSVEKHGANTPVTLGHLLNIAKLADQLFLLGEADYDRRDSEARQAVFEAKYL